MLSEIQSVRVLITYIGVSRACPESTEATLCGTQEAGRSTAQVRDVVTGRNKTCDQWKSTDEETMSCA